MTDLNPQRIDQAYEKLLKETEEAGYRLNPDVEFTRGLVEGLLVNQDRYGYWACPCRLASGNREEDLDIICPCDYRDPDIEEYGVCYCALYVSEEVYRGEKEVQSIPERRPPEEERRKHKKQEEQTVREPGETVTLRAPSGDYSLWRCKVCGYICARDNPPGRCPVCKVTRDRFEPVAGLE